MGGFSSSDGEPLGIVERYIPRTMGRLREMGRIDEHLPKDVHHCPSQSK